MLSREAPIIPSTTINGCAFEPTVEIPLRRIMLDALGLPPSVIDL